jgi:tRNA pseudouridine55 synthase
MTKGILLVDKPANITSFGVVSLLRRRSGVQKIGHGGTLDPFATGLLVLLIGRDYTKRAGEYLEGDKEYQTTLALGSATDTYDLEGVTTATSDKVPTLEEVTAVVSRYQGALMQVPPMFSAKKIAGKKLYELARKGIEIDRPAKKIQVTCTIIRYEYPELELHVRCSKGTYVRSLAYDIGNDLGCFAHLSQLRRIRSGEFCIDEAISLETMKDPSQLLDTYLLANAL